MINNPILMDSGVYVWEKYDVATIYTKNESTSGKKYSEVTDFGSGSYEGYTFDKYTGTFSMTGDSSYTTSPYYKPSTSDNKIYKCQVVTIVGSTNTACFPITSELESVGKGSTCYGTVTSEDEDAYPADGEQDGYWYVLVGKTST